MNLIPQILNNNYVDTGAIFKLQSHDRKKQVVIKLKSEITTLIPKRLEHC